MKNSVIILGTALVLVSFSTICNAKNTASLSNTPFQNIILSDDSTETTINEAAKFKKPAVTKDVEVFHPETVIASSPKTIKESIAEGDKIVEYTVSTDLEFMEYEESMKKIIAQSDAITANTFLDVIYPLYTEKTIYDEVAEMELIIESKLSDEVQPLDFKKINAIMINSINAKKNLGMN